MSAPAPAPDLQALWDEKQCRDVLMAYGPALDWLDEAALARLFWPDAAIDYGFFKGAAADFIPLVMTIERTALRRFHLTAGERIVLDGDQAQAESYGVTQAVSKGADGALSAHVFYGRYLDRLEKRGGMWRFSARTYLLHGASGGPYAEAEALAGLPKAEGLSPAHPLFIPIQPP